MKLDKQFSNMKLKQLLSENVLGSLPSSKLMKMKWNPLTGKTMNEEDEETINEASDITKSLNPDLDKHLGEIAKLWKKWKNGLQPDYKRSSLKPAGDELTHYILLWMRKTFK